VDIKAELSNFKPIDVENIVQKDEKVPDNVRNSIFLYNKAIESLRSGSEDIAIIELRKAVSMNPNFNEALNLLGLCYSYTGDMEKASEVFSRVVSAEPNSAYAIDYMQRFGIKEATTTATKSRQLVKTIEKQPGEPLKRIRNKKPEKAERPKKTIKSFIIGNNKNKGILITTAKIGAGFAVGFLLSAIIYASIPEPEPVQLPPKEDEIKAAVSEVTIEFEAKYAELEKKYEAVQKDKENAVKQADYYKAAVRIYEIESLVSKKDYESAADMLLLMKTIEFSDGEKEKFDDLYKKVMPLAAKSAYDTGYKQYNQRKYQDSIKSFEKIQIYDANYSKMNAALYYMGRCYQVQHDSRTALALFQQLVNNYPESWYTRNARIRINELTKVP
jgi:tetratricopeptide (TPR) repeat protein